MEEASGPPVEVWPGNAEAVIVFQAMATQWRTGFNGATGLDYAALPVVLRFTHIPRASWSAVFDDLQVMETAALEFMHKK